MLEPLQYFLSIVAAAYFLKLCRAPRGCSGTTLFSTFMFSSWSQVVLAQAPVNDVVSWPPGLLLLATIMYAAIATAPDHLWEIEPCIGFFLANGLPKFSIPGMKKVTWVTSACHFLPRIRSASGVSNFWVRANGITHHARMNAMRMVLKVMHCVFYDDPRPYNASLWGITPAGLVTPLSSTTTIVSPEDQKKEADSESESILPSPRDFLLFAAIDYHAFREWHVDVYSEGNLIFSTNGMPPSSVIDVGSPEEALPVVVAQMVRRPQSQSPLRALAHEEASDDNYGPYSISLEHIPPNISACSIDFHSYSPDSSKVSGSIQELAVAYYNVVQYLKSRAPDILGSSTGRMAQIDVGQTLWIAILSGALFEDGRLSIQNLPGRWSVKGASPDDIYLSRLEAILKVIEPHGMTSTFSEIVYSNGIARRSAYPFLIAGIFAQAIACYFLTVGTSAGVWTSVALANSLFIGRLTDLHSLFWGKTTSTVEPGMKLRASPGSDNLLAIATFNRTAPRQGHFRAGFLLNLVGLLASIMGAIFQEQTRAALGFAPFAYTPAWVVYTSITLCLGMSLLISVTIAFQQAKEKTWFDASELPTRWVAYTTLIPSCIVSGLAIYFFTQKLTRFWPVLDAIIWLSGLPLGMIENGYLVSMDMNTLHMLLLNRWIMGAVASAVGSAARIRN